MFSVPTEQSQHCSLSNLYNLDIKSQECQSKMYGQLPVNQSYPISSIQKHYQQQSNAMRTVYIGHINSTTSISEVIDLVRTGPIQAIRPLPEKNGMFITFVDASDASQFYNEAITSHHILHGSELKIGWGKPNTMTLAIQNALRNGASRNVYLGMLDESTTEESLRDNLSRFGYIEHIRMIPEKRIAFVHFLCITNAIKCVNTLPTESTWHLKRVNFGKDRCTRYQFQQKILYQPHSSIYSPLELFSGLPMVFQQQNRRDLITGLANRTVYLGNIHPDTTAEDICNVIRGGILSQIRFLPEKHIAFITFVDPNLASLFITQTLQQCLIVKGRRLKIGWGKPSALPIQVIQAVQNGGSRNVYIGNIDDSITEERLKHDFSEYGDIELVNTLKEKKCAFVNFTSIASAARAIEGIKSKEEYKKFHINYGKDRCGNPPKTQQRTRQGEDEDVQV